MESDVVLDIASALNEKNTTHKISIYAPKRQREREKGRIAVAEYEIKLPRCIEKSSHRKFNGGSLDSRLLAYVVYMRHKSTWSKPCSS